MVNIHILRNLYDSGAVQLLLQEGYLAADQTEDTDDTCNKLFLYPYQYCNLEIDDEYNNGRMTWIPGRTDIGTRIDI